jgi:hypothetical protein
LKAEEMMKFEMAKGNKKKEFYSQMAQYMGFKEIQEMASEAIKVKNMAALEAMAYSNIYAVTAALSNETIGDFFSQHLRDAPTSNFIPRLFFMIRTHAPLSVKAILKRLTRISILKSSLNISGKGIRGNKRRYISYYPGLPEFDIEQTILNYIDNGMHYLRYEDIVGISRTQIKKTVVLMLDTSGSMYGDLLLNAALTTAVLSYAMQKDDTSIILFSSEAYTLKAINEQKSVVDIINSVLDIEAVGFTNISAGLVRGLRQLRKAKGTRKFGILITDGFYNRGTNPANVARLFPKLHVIGMPQSQQIKSKQGQEFCKLMAKLGKGIYLQVKNYYEIPRALMKLISKA